MKRFNLLFALTFIFTITISCDKSDSDSVTVKSEYIKNPLLANNQNSLQAIFTASDNSVKSYYYGTFNSAGEPDNIKEMVINDVNKNSYLNIFFDDQLRAKYIYESKNGMKENVLITFDYDTAEKTTVKVFNYNFENFDSRLVYEFTVDNATQNVESQMSYASFTSILSLPCKIYNSLAPMETYKEKITRAVNGLVGAVAISGAGLVLAGAIVGTPGAILLGGLAAYVLINKNLTPDNVNETIDSVTPPDDAPESPTAQTQNTQLNTTSYFIATKATSGEVPFGGGAICQYIVEYTNVDLEIKFNNQTNEIIWAHAYATMQEHAVSCQIGILPIQKHYYQILQSQVNGNNITINFSQNPGTNPPNTTTFTGTISDNQIAGQLVLNRNDLPCIVNIPMTARKN